MNDPKPDDNNAFRFSLWRMLASLVFTLLCIYFLIAAYANTEDCLELVIVFFLLAIVFFAAAVGVLYRQAIDLVMVVILRIITAWFGV